MSAMFAILQKELRETLWQRSALWTQLMPLALVALAFSMGPPLLFGLGADASKSATLAISPWFAVGGMIFVAFFWVMANGVDAIAGERERHTIETLVASPATRGAIVFGKIWALVMVAVFFAVAMAALNGSLLAIFYGMDDVWPALLILLIGPVLAAFAAIGLGSLAFLISYRARTVKAAAATLGLVVFPVFVAMPALTTLLDPDRIATTGIVLLMVAGVAFLVAPAVLLVLAFVLFRRDRVIAV